MFCHELEAHATLFYCQEGAVRFTPPVKMPLEKALARIQDGELVEVTPKSIRATLVRAEELGRSSACIRILT